MSAEIIYGVDFRSKSRTFQTSEEATLEQQAAGILHEALFGAPLFTSQDLIEHDLITIPHYHDKDPA